MILLKNRDRNPSFKKGEYVEINDAGNYPMELSVYGVCEQETTTGKQLLDYDNLTNIGQLTKINPYGFRITGTKAWTYGNFTIDLKANTKYTFKCLFNQIDEMSSIEVSIREENGKIIKDLISSKKNGTLIGSFTTETITKISFYFYSNLSATPMTTTCDFTYLQIVEGEYTDVTMPDFEPYTGGQPSPSPDFPQNISVLTGNLKLTSCGKNLFDINSLNFENVWIRPTGEKVAANNNGFLSYVEILPNAEYILSLNRIVSSIGICEYDKDKNFIQRIVVSNSSSKTIITSTTTKFIGVFINIDGTTLVTKDIIYECEPQLEKSNQATTYEPYQSSSLNITIPENEFVGKLNDTYKDTLNIVYKDDGNYHLILNKMIGKVVLDGSGTSYIVAANVWGNHVFAYTGNNNIKPWGKGLSDYFTFVQGTFSAFVLNNGEFCIGQSAIIFRNDAINTLDEFKTWLSTHNLEVYYALATPYEVDLGIVDTLLSYDEITNLFTDSDLYPVINVKYYKDFEFDKILRSGYNIDEQEYEIAKKQMANGKRKRILSSYDDCIIKINLGLLDNKTYQEYKEQLDDGEFHYWSYKYNQYKKANFILTKPSITTEYAYDDDIGIDDMEITLEKSSDVS